MKRVIFVLALSMMSIATTRPAFAQIQGGSISGTVKDEQGGVLFNANTALVRNNNIGSPQAFNVLAQNLSPRIFRVGLVVGF